MVEAFVLAVFAAMLVVGIVLNIALWKTLALGFVLFFAYGFVRGHKVQDLLRMSTKGIHSVYHVLILFVIIGALTASWRAAGTIPVITVWSSKLVTPSTLFVGTFALCSLMSFLTGSSFGAAATIGVVCVTLGRAMGANVALLGGAVLSGSFFGDRCSPMSSSAALVSSLTGTRQQDNIRRMMRIALVPLVVSALIYLALGVNGVSAGKLPDFTQAFAQGFNLNPLCVLPVALVLVLSFAHVSVRKTMLVSLACALMLCVGVQHLALLDLPRILVMGYTTQDAAVAEMVNGGGIRSMAELVVIVSIASTYSGLFEGTGLLDGLSRMITRVSRRTTAFTGVLLTSVITSIIACDQVVATMLTSQLCDKCERSGSALALDLENSCIVLPALVPWSTSAVGILAFVGAPLSSIPFALYAMLLPAWTLALSVWQLKHPEFVDSRAARHMGLESCDDIRRLEPQGDVLLDGTTTMRKLAA